MELMQGINSHSLSFLKLLRHVTEKMESWHGRLLTSLLNELGWAMSNELGKSRVMYVCRTKEWIFKLLWCSTVMCFKIIGPTIWMVDDQNIVTYCNIYMTNLVSVSSILNIFSSSACSHSVHVAFWGSLVSSHCDAVQVLKMNKWIFLDCTAVSTGASQHEGSGFKPPGFSVWS